MKTVDKYQFNEQITILEDQVPTYSAVHTVLKKKFLFKMVTFGTHNQNQIYSYLMKEAQILKKINHENIYKCQKLLRSKNNFYAIFDQTEGETLEHLTTQTVPFDQKLKIIRQIIETVLQIYSKNIVYLNLRPSNIIIQQNNKILLKNFGYAQEFQKDQNQKKVPKTPRQIDLYLPPQLTLEKAYRNSDFYSLGVIIATFFKKQFEVGRSQLSKQSVQVKFQNYNINYSINLNNLKELCTKLSIKNNQNRLNLIQYLSASTKRLESPKSARPRLTKKAGESPLKLAPKLSIDYNINSSTTKPLENTSQLEKLRSSKSIVSLKTINNPESKKQKLNSIEQIITFMFKKRGFSILLLNLSQSCLKNKQSNISTSLIISFLLIKKATITIMQLAKLLNQGHNLESSANEKHLEFVKKSASTQKIFTMINNEMSVIQNKFQQILLSVKKLPQISKCQALQLQLKSEQVNSLFLKKSVMQYLLQMSLLPTDQYVSQFEQGSICYLYILSQLADFQHLEDIYQTFFAQDILNFQEQPFVQTFEKISKKKIVELIQININKIYTEIGDHYTLAVKTTKTIK